MSLINIHELNSLRFYQGDLENYSGDFEKYNSDFYKTKGAYQVLNMLLYPGLENEKARICGEHKILPVKLLKNMEEVIQVYENIFTAMCKYQKGSDNIKVIHLYRKDRMQSIEMFKHNSLLSFTSCSMKDEIEEYFYRKKAGILLLEFDVPSFIPYIVINEVLGDNPYKRQEEVLLPPFLEFEREAMEFNEKELRYRDRNDELPKAKYLIKIKCIDSSVGLHCSCDEESLKYAMNKIFDAGEINHAINLLERLHIDDTTILEEEVRQYCEWKNAVQTVIKIKFGKIYGEMRGHCDERKI